MGFHCGDLCSVTGKSVRDTVEELALRWFVLSSYLVSSIPLVLHTCSLFSHLCRIMLAVNSTVNNTSVGNWISEVVHYVTLMLLSSNFHRLLNIVSFFWVIPRCLNFICQRFRTLCLFHLHRQVGVKNDWG